LDTLTYFVPTFFYLFFFPFLLEALLRKTVVIILTLVPRQDSEYPKLERRPPQPPPPGDSPFGNFPSSPITIYYFLSFLFLLDPVRWCLDLSPPAVHFPFSLSPQMCPSEALPSSPRPLHAQFFFPCILQLSTLPSQHRVNLSPPPFTPQIVQLLRTVCEHPCQAHPQN